MRNILCVRDVWVEVHVSQLRKGVRISRILK